MRGVSRWALKELTVPVSFSAAFFARFYWSLAFCNFLIQPALAQTQLLDQPTPTALPAVAPEAVRKAYMNCLLEVDRIGQELITNQKAREEESRMQLKFCENRKKECSLNRDSAECRTFVEEFASE
jgi:hypothetical protein